jgi:hypothetical protein
MLCLDYAQIGRNSLRCINPLNTGAGFKADGRVASALRFPRTPHSHSCLSLSELAGTTSCTFSFIRGLYTGDQAAAARLLRSRALRSQLIAQAAFYRYVQLEEMSFWSSLAKLWRRQRARDSSRECCEAMQWERVADFDSVTGIDLDLGRCKACGEYVMCVSYYGWDNYVRVTEERAKYWLALQQEDPERLRRVLKAWAN